MYLDVVPFMVKAALPEQPVRDDLVFVELVENGVGVLIVRVSTMRKERGEKDGPCLDWR